MKYTFNSIAKFLRGEKPSAKLQKKLQRFYRDHPDMGGGAFASIKAIRSELDQALKFMDAEYEKRVEERICAAMEKELEFLILNQKK